MSDDGSTTRFNLVSMEPGEASSMARQTARKREFENSAPEAFSQASRTARGHTGVRMLVSPSGWIGPRTVPSSIA